MNTPSQTIQSIRQFLSGGGQPGPEGAAIAGSYAELCVDANRRLGTCLDFIQRGMLSEAVHAAEAEPSLLDLCVQIDFPEAAEWRKLCAQSRWPVPPSLDAQAIGKLNEAYGSALSTEPLLKNYRTHLLRKDHDSAVRVLRALTTKDPSNIPWKEDLIVLERKVLARLESEYAQGSSRDLVRLGHLEFELEQNWMLDAEVASLRERVRESMRGLKSERAAAAAAAAVGEVERAFASRSKTGVANALATLDSLETSEFLKPEASRVTRTAASRAWLADLQAKAQAHAEHEQLIADLEADLAKREPSVALESLMDRLRAATLPLPAGDLLERAQRAVENRHAQARRRKALTVFAVSFLFVVAAVTLGVLQYNKAVHVRALAAAAELRKSFDTFDVPTFNAILDKAQASDKAAWKQPEVQAWAGRRLELRALVKAKLDKFESSLAFLSEQAGSGFPAEEAAVESALTLARANLLDGKQEIGLAKVTATWSAELIRRQQARDLPFREKLGAIATLWEQVGTAETNTPVRLAEFVASLGQLAAEAKVLPRVSPALLTALEEQEARREVAAKVVARKNELMDKMQRSALLPDYLVNLRTYAETFPGDEFTRTVALEGRLAGLAEDLVLFTGGRGQSGKLDASAVENSFWWKQSVSITAERRNALDIGWKETDATLADWVFADRANTQLWEVDYQKSTRAATPETGHGFVLFLTEPPVRSSPEIYVPGNLDTRPVFSRISSLELTAVKAAAHVEVVKALQNNLKTAKGVGDLALAQALLDLFERPGVNGMLKYNLCQKWYKELVKYLPSSQRIALTEPDYFSVSLGDPPSWLCRMNGKVEAATGRAAKELERLAKSSLAADLRRYIQDARMHAHVVENGYDFALVAPVLLEQINATLYPSGLYGIRESAKDGPQLYLLGIAQGGITRLLGKVHPGEPLFTWGGRTRPNPAEFMHVFGSLTTEPKTAWPAAWPVNLRKVK